MASSKRIFYELVIDNRKENRIDPGRAGGAVSIRPAQLTNEDDVIPVVAKITFFDGDEATKKRLLRSTNLHRKVQDHVSNFKVYGYKIIDNEKFVLILEPADGSLEDALRPKTARARDFSNKLFAKHPPKDIIKRFFSGLSYVRVHTIDDIIKITHRDVVVVVVVERHSAHGGHS
jgi:hypothetical protein